MSQYQLNCPHCDGAFSLDRSAITSAQWSCPYCGKKSLLQKTEDGIRVRGILHESVSAVPISIDSQNDKSAENQSIAQESRSLSDYIAEIDQPEPPSTEIHSTDQIQEAPDEVTFEKLVQQAENAAKNHLLPLFNSLSRQVLDRNPLEGRIYACRARLIEEADGFASTIWATPLWYLYTPRQKSARLIQHFFALNTAIQFIDDPIKGDLCTSIGRLLVRQAVDHLTEKAELRCAGRWFGKTFKGRYRKADLREAQDFCDAVSRIDASICPQGYQWIQQSVRYSASQLNRKLQRALTRFPD